MSKEQILNLVDVDAEDFEAIQNAVEEWKASGLSGSFGFVSEQEKQECIAKLKQVLQESYNEGVIAGGVAAFAGIAVGVMIEKTYSYFKAKKEKKVE